MTLANGTMLNKRYEIIRPIGSGGMAEVYLAKDILLDREVAVKMLREQFQTDKLLLEQFKREAKSAAKLVHPNIINIYDVVTNGEEKFIVMEYVDGINLRHYMEQTKLTTEQAIDIVIHLADGLHHAHKHHVVHCDIKPLNILIDKYMQPKIADFGIAKMVSNQTMVYTNAIMGSVHYISPEQATGDKVTSLSDVYSLGVVLFEMLTGQVPYDGTTPVAVAMMHTEKAVPQLKDYMQEVPEGLQEIIDKAMAKKPEDRYQSVLEFRSDLVKLIVNFSPGTHYEVDLPMGVPHHHHLDTGESTLNNVKRPASSDKQSDEDGDTLVMQPVRGKKDAKLADTVIIQRGEGGTLLDTNMQLEKALEAIEQEKRKALEAIEKEKKKEEELMAVKKKKMKLNYVRVLLLVTGVVVFISIIAHFLLGGSKNEVVVPNVVNMNAAEAEKEIESLKLKVRIEEKFADVNQHKPGVVISQSVRSGEKRKEGSTIILAVSKGAEEKEVPELKGMSLQKATNTLENMGFKVGRVDRRYVKNEKLGSVLDQTPKAKEKLAKGSAVILVMNEGDRTIPSLIGKTKEEAVTLLRRAGLALGNVRVVTDYAVKKDVVITTNPDAGVALGEGDKVDITVSDGGPQNSTYVDFAIPGSKMSRVNIYIEDSDGRREVFSGVRKGGIRIRQKVDVRGGAKATLVIDGNVAEVRNL